MVLRSRHELRSRRNHSNRHSQRYDADRGCGLHTWRRLGERGGYDLGCIDLKRRGRRLRGARFGGRRLELLGCHLRFDWLDDRARRVERGRGLLYLRLGDLDFRLRDLDLDGRR